MLLHQIAMLLGLTKTRCLCLALYTRLNITTPPPSLCPIPGLPPPSVHGMDIPSISPPPFFFLLLPPPNHSSQAAARAPLSLHTACRGWGTLHGIRWMLPPESSVWRWQSHCIRCRLAASQTPAHLALPGRAPPGGEYPAQAEPYSEKGSLPAPA